MALHFPDAKTMVQYICAHRMLKIDYPEGAAVISAIAELAAKRFANQEKEDFSVSLGTINLIQDLQDGRDSITGASLPNFGNLPPDFWYIMTQSTMQVLLKCGKLSTKTS